MEIPYLFISGSQGRSAPGDIVAVFGDILVDTVGERECYWHLLIEAKDAARHPALHRSACCARELFGPKCC